MHNTVAFDRRGTGPRSGWRGLARLPCDLAPVLRRRFRLGRLLLAELLLTGPLLVLLDLAPSPAVPARWWSRLARAFRRHRDLGRILLRSYLCRPPSATVY